MIHVLPPSASPQRDIHSNHLSPNGGGMVHDETKPCPDSTSGYLRKRPKCHDPPPAFSLPACTYDLPGISSESMTKEGKTWAQFTAGAAWYTGTTQKQTAVALRPLPHPHDCGFRKPPQGSDHQQHTQSFPPPGRKNSHTCNDILVHEAWSVVWWGGLGFGRTWVEYWCGGESMGKVRG